MIRHLITSTVAILTLLHCSTQSGRRTEGDDSSSTSRFSSEQGKGQDSVENENGYAVPGFGRVMARIPTVVDIDTADTTSPGDDVTGFPLMLGPAVCKTIRVTGNDDDLKQAFPAPFFVALDDKACRKTMGLSEYTDLIYVARILVNGAITLVVKELTKKNGEEGILISGYGTYEVREKSSSSDKPFAPISAFCSLSSAVTTAVQLAQAVSAKCNASLMTAPPTQTPSAVPTSAIVVNTGESNPFTLIAVYDQSKRFIDWSFPTPNDMMALTSPTNGRLEVQIDLSKMRMPDYLAMLDPTLSAYLSLPNVKGFGGVDAQLALKVFAGPGAPGCIANSGNNIQVADVPSAMFMAAMPTFQAVNGIITIPLTSAMWAYGGNTWPLNAPLGGAMPSGMPDTPFPSNWDVHVLISFANFRISEIVYQDDSKYTLKASKILPSPQRTVCAKASQWTPPAPAPTATPTATPTPTPPPAMP